MTPPHERGPGRARGTAPHHAAALPPATGPRRPGWRRRASATSRISVVSAPLKPALDALLSLRAKTLLAIAATLLGLSFALYGVSSRALLANSMAAEAQDTRRTVQVALNLFRQASSDFNARWTDWSQWDDAYAFVQDGNQEFVRSNLVAQLFDIARIDLAVFAGADGTPVYSTGYDHATKSWAPLPRGIAERLRVGDLLFGRDAPSSAVRGGIVLLPDGPMLLCSQPSVGSSGRGPVAGTVTFGRFLTDAEIKRLTEPAGLSLAVHRLDDPQLPDDFREARAALSERDPILVHPLGGDRIAGYTVLDDIDGKPALLVRVDNDRAILRMGHDTLRYLVLVTVVVGLVFGGVTLLLLEKLVLYRLARLSREVTEIGDVGDLSARVAMPGTDELSRLTGSINGMLSALEANARRQSQQKAALEQAKAAAEQAHERSDRLLLNILPRTIADQLKEQEQLIAEHFEEVTVLFADIAGFTPLAARLPPAELVGLLNRMFSSFDQLAEQHGLEKIKTIGDAYMVVGGLPAQRPDHARAIARMAIAMTHTVRQFVGDDGEPFQLRIGINTGPVIAGVIGKKKFSYDLWGDAVNVASRMESSGEPGRIQVSEASYSLLARDFLLEERGLVAIKGKGAMKTYWLIGENTPQ
ncbi:putative adenylate cyclase [Sorangium cellulosum So ce56]|uniref:Adenylate cyclase n=1 Tax=Sorangium cellulosum (strain So ce56) TaxID=448385 RepID=A9GVA6_SORC5|nr:putative adenylate cyclase [Sorangium cellulosum So ce56]